MINAPPEDTILKRLITQFIISFTFLNARISLIVWYSVGFGDELSRRVLRSQLVNYVQSVLHCCGVTQESYRDWNENPYFNCSVHNPSTERCSVPSSCCRQDTELIISAMCGKNVMNLVEHDAWQASRSNSSLSPFSPGFTANPNRAKWSPKVGSMADSRRFCNSGQSRPDLVCPPGFPCGTYSVPPRATHMRSPWELNFVRGHFIITLRCEVFQCIPKLSMPHFYCVFQTY